MTVIVVLIAISLTIALTFLAIFFWCVKSGQYDDTYTPAVRMLFENEGPKEKGQNVKGNSASEKEFKNDGNAAAAKTDDEASLTRRV